MKLHVCACGRPIVPPKRKCMRCLPRKGKTTILRPSTRGRNKVGIAAHKPSKARTKRAKRQNPQVMGSVPHLRTSVPPTS